MSEFRLRTAISGLLTYLLTIQLTCLDVVHQGRLAVSSLTELLDSLKLKQGVSMTTRSLRLLNLPPTEHEAFASAHKDGPLKRQVYLLGYLNTVGIFEFILMQQMCLL